MSSALQKILVVGGNGFIGSMVCKLALARGMQVISVSSSGQPYHSPKGHTPAWASKVDWQVTAVVHTLGTLLEYRYKKALKAGDFPALLSSLANEVFGGSGNPLEKGGEEAKKNSYEVINRDSALRTCEAFLSTSPVKEKTAGPRPFVYISAEDVFRPMIPARYVETKREAEQGIENMMLDKPNYRGVYIRPSLVYHAHQRPLTSPMAAILDLSASLHAKAPTTIPTPSSVLRSLGRVFPPTPSLVPSSPLESVANALVIPPIHVEHVAEAICVAVENPEVRGVVGVRDMRQLIGWEAKGQSQNHVGVS